MGVEEKGALGKRELESGLGSVLRTAGTMTWPVWVMRLMRMARLVRVVGLVGVVWPMGVVRLVGVIWSVGMVRSIRVVWPGRMARPVTFRGRSMRMTWLARMIRLMGMVRMVRGFGPVGVMRRLAMAVMARAFDLLRLGPIHVFVALQLLVGTKTNLQSLSAFRVCRVKKSGVHTHEKSSGTMGGVTPKSVNSGSSMLRGLCSP